ncbi:transcriptional regulator PpsR [uncultured Enterovirga sp.]|uniref:transcriptional regulator PpsR n=1 Tax=uncultured Enterovirga sp. TaxID=2026352 RepID=UPI0035CBA776
MDREVVGYAFRDVHPVCARGQAAMVKPDPATRPDVTLVLDREGLVQQTSVTDTLSEPDVSEWLGRPWQDTVADGAIEVAKAMIKDAETEGVSGFQSILQRFPSGRELPIEYTMVRFGGNAGYIAVGKRRHAVAELEFRLNATQRAMERDYWKLRQLESRYRHLFNTSNDAVLLVAADETLSILEANPQAIRALAPALHDVVDRDLLSFLVPRQQNALRDMLGRVREEGKVPGVLIHLGAERRAWIVRATPAASEGGSVFLLQLSALDPVHFQRGSGMVAPLPALIDRLPHGFVAIDRDGVIRHTNRAFRDLAQVSADESLAGQHLGHWLREPGAGVDDLLAALSRDGVVEEFATMIHGDLGSRAEIGVAAARDTETEFRFVALSIRHLRPLGRRSDQATSLLSALGDISAQLGKEPLRAVVDRAVGLIERHCIENALELTAGNRSAAADILGLSRQSLYAKLDRYQLALRSEVAPLSET